MFFPCVDSICYFHFFSSRSKENDDREGGDSHDISIGDITPQEINSENDEERKEVYDEDRYQISIPFSSTVLAYLKFFSHRQRNF